MWSSAISSQFLILVFITAFIKDTIAYFVTVRYHIQISKFKTAFKKYISKTYIPNLLCFQVDAHAEECFFDRVKKGTKMGLMFEVAEGGFLDIDVRIEGNLSHLA